MKFLITILTIILLLISCKSAKKDTPESSATGTMEDRMTAYAIISSTSFLYNQNIAGTATGAKNTKIDCLQGGKTQVTGTTSNDKTTGISTDELKWQNSECRIVAKEYDITMTGELEEKGSWRNTTVIQEGYTTKAYNSDSFKAKGSVTSSSQTFSFDIDCPIAISNSTGKVSGTICERKFSY